MASRIKMTDRNLRDRDSEYVDVPGVVGEIFIDLYMVNYVADIEAVIDQQLAYLKKAFMKRIAEAQSAQRG